MENALKPPKRILAKNKNYNPMNNFEKGWLN